MSEERLGELQEWRSANERLATPIDDLLDLLNGLESEREHVKALEAKVALLMAEHEAAKEWWEHEDGYEFCHSDDSDAWSSYHEWLAGRHRAAIAAVEAAK
jgi:hypothetical protein